MPTPKKNLQTLEDMMLNYYYSTVKEGEKFPVPRYRTSPLVCYLTI
jgi:hypothetical protein